LGNGGERLDEWVFPLASFRERHGLSGGEINADDEVVAESLRATGAVVMGRRMFSGGEGPWEDDPRADGWWGDEPPFRVPVFVLTHHARDTVIKRGGTSFIFVTAGIEAAQSTSAVAGTPTASWLSCAPACSVVRRSAAPSVAAMSAKIAPTRKATW
jgi:dihydrofolate reductase